MKKSTKLILSFWMFFALLLVLMGATRHVYLNGPHLKGPVKEVVVFLSSFLSNIANLGELKTPILIESQLKLKHGFTYSEHYKGSKDYLLISVWDAPLSQSVVKLVRISDGYTVHKWVVDMEQINPAFNQMENYGKYHQFDRYNTSILHPLVLKDGSLIFSAGGIYKIDKNSKLIWSNTTFSHHSIEIGPHGNYWICSNNSDRKNTEKFKIRDDVIVEIDANSGAVLYEKSVYEILLDNGYSNSELFICSEVVSPEIYLDYFHLNDVQPVLENSIHWNKGDLFLSLRHQNLVLLYRPSSNKIIWSKKGPWLKQHDVTILDSTTIGIFGNDVLDANFSDKKGSLVNGFNKQYLYDFTTHLVTTPYDGFLQKSQVGTLTDGRAQVLEDGTIFIEETNYGRLLLGNKKDEIWSYVERINEKQLSLFNWSRYITASEFNTFTFLE